MDDHIFLASLHSVNLLHFPEQLHLQGHDQLSQGLNGSLAASTIRNDFKQRLFLSAAQRSGIFEVQSFLSRVSTFR